MMKKNQFPKGWDEERVRRVLAHYENQTEEDAVAEDEKAWASMSLEMAMRGMEDEEMLEYTMDDVKEIFSKVGERRITMPVIQLEAQVPADKLLQAVEQLTQPELEKFASDVNRLIAKRKAPSLSHREAELLLKINQGVPMEVHQRYSELIAKRRDETLREDEYTELMQLTNQVEEMDAQRIAYLAELANLRGTSLTALMDTLGITTPPYV